MVDMLQEFESVALLGCKTVREFLVCEGENKQYLPRAKVGAMTMGAYARLRATIANERALDLQSQKLK